MRLHLIDVQLFVQPSAGTPSGWTAPLLLVDGAHLSRKYPPPQLGAGGVPFPIVRCRSCLLTIVNNDATISNKVLLWGSVKMLTLAIGVSIGFMAAIAIVVWQWSAISKLKRAVDELHQSSMLNALPSSAKLSHPRAAVKADPFDVLLESLDEIKQRITPQASAPADPMEMLVRRIHQIEQDVLSSAQATHNNTSAIEHHSSRLDANASENSRILRDISGMESDFSRDIDGLRQKFDSVDQRIKDLTARVDRTFGQLGAGLDAVTTKLIDVSKRQASAAVTKKPE